MPGPLLDDRLAATRLQLDSLATALGRVDVEAIETSARALAALLEGLPEVATRAAAAGQDAEYAMLEDLQWQLVRCRRLGRLAGGEAAGQRQGVYRPNGQAQSLSTGRAQLKVAG